MGPSAEYENGIVISIQVEYKWPQIDFIMYVLEKLGKRGSHQALYSNFYSIHIDRALFLWVVKKVVKRKVRNKDVCLDISAVVI